MLFPRWPLTVFRLEIKADSGGKKGREGRDLAKQERSFCKGKSEDEPRARLKERSVTQHSHELQNSPGVDTLWQNKH